MPLIHTPNPGFAYYIPPKTGSTSVIAALTQAHSEAEVIYDKHGIYKSAAWWSLFHFATVRNPYTRVVSLWQFFEEHQTFQAFLRSTKLQRFRNKLWHAMPCTFWVHQMPRIDRLLYLENLQEDFQKLPFANCEIGLRRLNKTGECHNANGVRVQRLQKWYEYYREGDEALVQQIYKDDFDQLGYDHRLNAAIEDAGPRQRMRV